MNYKSIKSYEMNENLLYRENGEVLMVYNKDNGDMYEINDVGKEIFMCFKEGVVIKDILVLLSNEYNVLVSEIEDDFVEFITRMIELGVIIIN